MKVYENLKIKICVLSEDVLTQSNDALIQDSFDEFVTGFVAQ